VQVVVDQCTRRERMLVRVENEIGAGRAGGGVGGCRQATSTHSESLATTSLQEASISLWNDRYKSSMPLSSPVLVESSSGVPGLLAVCLQSFGRSSKKRPFAAL
jgi:hypothetical protein